MAQKNLLTNDPLNLNSEIRELAQTEELGELRQVYRTSKRHTTSLMLGMMILGLGIIFTLIPTLAVFLSPLHPSLISILPGLVLIVIGGVIAFPRKIYTHWRIYLWQAGFIHEKGHVRQVFRWDQIGSIKGIAAYSPQFGHSIIIYKVRRLDGLKVKLDATFPEIAALIDQILEAFARQVASPNLRILSHRRKTFVHFKLDRQGISNQSEALSWQEMGEIAVEHGVMTVFTKD